MQSFNTYSYIPSVHTAKSSKYSSLIKEYNSIFEKTILKGQKELNPDEKNTLWEGIVEVSNYISSSFNYIIQTNYDKKSPKAKAVTAMFLRLGTMFGSVEYFYKIQPTLSDLAQNSVLYSLGLDTYKNNKAFIWNKEKPNAYTTLIKHATEVVFIQLCYDFLSTEIQAIEAITESPEDFIEIGVQDSLSALEMIEKAGLYKKIPRNIEQALIDYLENGESENMDAILPYLNVIYKKLHLKAKDR